MQIVTTVAKIDQLRTDIDAIVAEIEAWACWSLWQRFWVVKTWNAANIYGCEKNS